MIHLNLALSRIQQLCHGKTGFWKFCYGPSGLFLSLLKLVAIWTTFKLKNPKHDKFQMKIPSKNLLRNNKKDVLSFDLNDCQESYKEGSKKLSSPCNIKASLTTKGAALRILKVPQPLHREKLNTCTAIDGARDATQKQNYFFGRRCEKNCLFSIIPPPDLQEEKM